MCSAMFQLCTITTMCDMSRLIRVFLFGFLVLVLDRFRFLRGETVRIGGVRSIRIEQAVDDFEESLSGEEVNPDNARRRGRLLARLAESLGTAAVTTSVAELVKAALAAGLT